MDYAKNNGLQIMKIQQEIQDVIQNKPTMDIEGITKEQINEHIKKCEIYLNKINDLQE